MSETLAPVQIARDDRELGWLLSKAGGHVTARNLVMLRATVARSKRARWLGVAGAVIAGGAGWAGSTGDALGIGLAWLAAGYLVGAVVAALLTSGRRASSPVHAASLTARGPEYLVTRWSRLLPWLTLLPCLPAPLLLLGDHPQGTVRVHDADGYAMATSAWFPPGLLFTTAAMALVGILCWEMLLTRLARRRLPVDNPDAAAVDMVARVLCARSAAAATAAIGLCLLSGLATASGDPLMSQVCTTVRDCHYVYGWHAHVQALQGLALLLLAAAALVYAVLRCRWVPAGRVLTAWARQ